MSLFKIAIFAAHAGKTVQKLQKTDVKGRDRYARQRIRARKIVDQTFHNTDKASHII